MIIIFIFCLIIDIIAAFVIVYHKLQTKELLFTVSTKGAIKILLSMIIIQCLTGVTWLFGILAFISVTSNNTVYHVLQALFIISIACQGLSFFLFFVLLSSADNWKLWMTIPASMYTSSASESKILASPTEGQREFITEMEMIESKFDGEGKEAVGENEVVNTEVDNDDKKVLV